MLAMPLQAPSLPPPPPMSASAPAAPAPAPVASGKAGKSPRVARNAPDGGLICDWDGCGTTHPDPDALYTHLCNLHIGRKATGNLCLSCKWPGCDITCIKRDHITSHLRGSSDLVDLELIPPVHTPLKPHTCDICSKSFKRPQDLKKHEKIHTEEHHTTHKHSRAVTVNPTAPLPARASVSAPTVAPPQHAAPAPPTFSQAPQQFAPGPGYNPYGPYAPPQHFNMASILAQQEALNQQTAAMLGYPQGAITNPYAAAASHNAVALAAHVARSSQQHAAIAAAAAAAAQAHRPFPPSYGYDASRPPALSFPSAPHSLYPSLPTFFDDVSSPESHQSSSAASPLSEASQHRRSPSLSSPTGPIASAHSPAYLSPNDAVLDPRGAGSSPGGTKRSLDEVADSVINEVKRGRYTIDHFTPALDAMADLLPADFSLPAMTRDDGMSSSSSSTSSPGAELRGLDSTLASPHEAMSKHDVDVLNDFLLQIGQDLEAGQGGDALPLFAPTSTTTSLYPTLDSYMHQDSHDALFGPAPTRPSLPPPAIAPNYSREPTFHHIELLQRAAPIAPAASAEVTLAPIDRPEAGRKTTLPHLRDLMDAMPPSSPSPSSLAADVGELVISSPPLTGVRRSHDQQRQGSGSSTMVSSPGADTAMSSSDDEDAGAGSDTETDEPAHKRSRLADLADLAVAAEQASIQQRRLDVVKYLALRVNARFRAAMRVGAAQ